MSDREPALLGDPSPDDGARSAQGGAELPPADPPRTASTREPSGAPRATGAAHREPHAAGTHRAPPVEPAHASAVEPAPGASAARREPPAVYVVGFWRRLVAAAIDLAIVVPAALLITVICSRITGLDVPENLGLFDIDLWLDLVLATDPALVMALALTSGIGLVYLLVFQIVVGRTPGMRVLRIKIIDVYGDRPSALRCVVRCGGYVAGLATLSLGFLWMGFDSEKRGVQDWIAGTYVIKA